MQANECTELPIFDGQLAGVVARSATGRFCHGHFLHPMNSTSYLGTPHALFWPRMCFWRALVSDRSLCNFQGPRGHESLTLSAEDFRSRHRSSLFFCCDKRRRAPAIGPCPRTPSHHLDADRYDRRCSPGGSRHELRSRRRTDARGETPGVQLASGWSGKASVQQDRACGHSPGRDHVALAIQPGDGLADEQAKLTSMMRRAVKQQRPLRSSPADATLASLARIYPIKAVFVRS